LPGPGKAVMLGPVGGAIWHAPSARKGMKASMATDLDCLIRIVRLPREDDGFTMLIWGAATMMKPRLQIVTRRQRRVANPA
jgi:hypothetical protein